MIKNTLPLIKQIFLSFLKERKYFWVFLLTEIELKAAELIKGNKIITK